MCGIAGIISPAGTADLDASLRRMTKVQFHRGPDDEASWLGRCGHQHIALGYNRLAVLDLTPAANQPVLSDSGRHVLVYNGEIYNFVELRDELEKLGVHFRSRCDSEVVLQSLMMWGEAALEKFNGMWAFAWLDLDRKRLLLSRDRFGEKPLFYYRSRNAFFFSSEVKGILAGSGERFSVNIPVVARSTQQYLVDPEESCFLGIRSVPAGHNACLDLSDVSAIPLPACRRYWTPPLHDESDGDLVSRIQSVRETFMDAVAMRLRSDVPIGVLLSGGIGSSSIATAVRQILGSDADLRMISAISDDARYDEQPYIDAMTAHLGCRTQKVAWRPDGKQAFRDLESVTYFNEHPVADFSIVVHYSLMQHAKDLGITVILSGQGDDELLCGYKKYLAFYLQELLRDGKWPAAARTACQFLARGTLLPQFTMAEAKRYLPKNFLTAGIDFRGSVLHDEGFLADLGLAENTIVSRQLADLTRFSLPAQVHYEDRMSMACSREIRLPFLDPRLVKLLLPLAPEWKLRDGWSKWIFRKAMENDMPPKVTWRKDKMGFDNPQAEWLKREFRPEVEAILTGELLVEACGFIDRAALQKAYSVYCEQSADSGKICFKDILSAIALEFWLRRFESHLSLDYARSPIDPAHSSGMVGSGEIPQMHHSRTSEVSARAKSPSVT
jgi:asparagine synthase (glutamine-hydrolysing)